VMNLGLGVERIAMILHNSKDIRALSYPQFQADWELTPREMAQMIQVDKSPSTDVGRTISNSIVKTCVEHGDTPSPCEFLAFEGEIHGRTVKVSVVEPEENTKLCGPAYLNEVVVHIRYIDAFADLAAYEVEIATLNGKDSETRIKIVRTPGELNLSIDPALDRYITSHKHKMDLRGPVFITVRSKVLE
jgi:O-phosphoseryl-tRNA synthetase